MKFNQSFKHLLVSQTRQKLINILFYRPHDIFYVRQLVRSADEEINSVRRELENLKKADVITSEWRGNRLYYQANYHSPVFMDLILLAHQSCGLGESLQTHKDKIGSIKLVVASYDLLMGNPNNSNNIDLIIVGDVSVKEVDSLIKSEEAATGREINYMIMGKQELKLRKLKRDPFIVDFFLNCPFILFGNPENLN